MKVISEEEHHHAFYNGERVKVRSLISNGYIAPFRCEGGFYVGNIIKGRCYVAFEEYSIALEPGEYEVVP